MPVPMPNNITLNETFLSLLFEKKNIAALVMSIGKRRELAVLRQVYVPCLCLAHLLLLDEVDT
jgi:hypothetical protein